MSRLRALNEAATPGDFSFDADLCSFDTPDGRAIVLMDDRTDAAGALALGELIVALRNVATELDALIDAAKAFDHETCPDCGGNRIIDGEPCDWCSETGVIFRDVSDDERNRLIDALAAVEAKL